MAHTPHKLLIIIPAYNEASVIGDTLQSVLQTTQKLPYQTTVVVVDDGSHDSTAEIASQYPVVLLHHIINRGLGGALGTGLAYAKQVQPEVTITFDADGQHDPQDIARIIQPIIQEHKDAVIGSRLLDNQAMKTDRWILNKLANGLTYILFGVQTTDSQSGLRAFSLKAVQLMTLKTQRMEVSSEFFQQIKTHHLKFAEIPIRPVYTEYSLSKGQDNLGNLNSINIILKLLLRVFR